MYDNQILQILTEVGERGISVKALVKHVYNQNVSLFQTPDLGEIQQYVRRYLQRNSHSPHSLIEHTGQWGRYRLNTRDNAEAQQLMLAFRDETEETSEELSGGAGTDERQVDLSLDLF